MKQPFVPALNHFTLGCWQRFLRYGNNEAPLLRGRRRPAGGSSGSGPGRRGSAPEREALFRRTLTGHGSPARPANPQRHPSPSPLPLPYSLSKRHKLYFVYPNVRPGTTLPPSSAPRDMPFNHLIISQNHSIGIVKHATYRTGNRVPI